MKRAAAVLVLVLSPGSAEAQQLIVIDPGHGGRDPGGTGNGLQEKEVVLDVSMRFRELLEADSADARGGGSWRVSLTRDGDEYVTVAARASYANQQGADRFMSIHSNAHDDRAANGTETFSYSANGNGAALRNLVQEEMLGAWGLRDRGNKTASFAVLRQTSMPAELHELAFITNAGDAARLASDEDRQRAAEAHLYALQRHFGLAPYLPSSVVAVGTIAGSVTDAEGGIGGATVVLDGEAPIVADERGAFGITDVPPGEHVVRAHSPAHHPSDQVVTVVADQTTRITFRLVPGDPCPRAGIDRADSGAGLGDGPGGGPGAGGCAVAHRRRGVPPVTLVGLLLIAIRRRH